MYPRNAASPPRIAVGAIYLIADGSKVVADASVVVRPEGGAEGAGGGTLVVGATSGVWYYTPTQAETNYTAFAVVVYKALCTVANITVVTTTNPTSGKALSVAEEASLAAIEADTNELETDWKDGGRLDLLLDALAPSAAANLHTEGDLIQVGS